MIDVSEFIFKLEVLKRYLASCIDGEMQVFTPCQTFGEYVTMTDRSGFVGNIPFDEFYLYAQYVYQPINSIQ